MKKSKIQKAFIGKFISSLPEIFSKVSNGVIGGDSSVWSKDKMAGLSSYAPGSYGRGEKSTGQKTAKAKKGSFIITKGKDYLKDLL